VSYITPVAVFALASAGLFFLAGALHYIVETFRKEN
jgi:hypothetical protein